MADYIITTENTADLPATYLADYNIPYLKLSYIIGDEIYPGEADFDVEGFYGQIKNGIMPTTSQVTVGVAKEFFEGFLKEGKDVLHIAFSSGLSGTCNSCYVAAKELEEEYPDRKIYVVDSLCASLGEGLLVHHAIQQKNAGKTIDELREFLEETKLHMCHLFTVDDLFHLHRGGRVSKLEAVAGSVIGIKPVLHVDNNGKLVATGKVRGRKASLKALIDNMSKQIGDWKNDTVFICHSDCYHDAELLKNMVQEKFGIEHVMINSIGPVIGSHTGVGTVSVFFLGDER